MTFDTAIKELNDILNEKQPDKFSSSWVVANSPRTYRYICKNIRTPLNNIDWDTVTSSLDRCNAKKFIWYKKKIIKPYENQDELDCVLVKYKDKLYTFITLQGEEDRNIRNKIIVALVRVAQKGNILAEQSLIEWMSYITTEWSEKYPQIWKWRGRDDEVRDKIKGCIRCYKYTGSFPGYLFKTLEYSARGIPPEVSLDDTVGEDGARKIDFITFDN